MSTVKIFITGSSGYIGGTVLTDLLKTPEKYKITALIRKKEHGEMLEKLGVTPIYGSLDDTNTLFEAAKASDVVISTADADHLPSVQAMVNGLKAKKDKKAVFLHTSGTGVLTYDPVTTVPFDDEDINRIHAIPYKALHKDIDSWIFDNIDDITAAIIAPSTINGIGTGFLKKNSQQVINMAQVSALRRKTGFYGERKDVTWGNVNILDLGDLYILVLEGLLSGAADNGKSGGWYFGTTNEHTWYKIAEQMAPILHKYGLVDNSEVSQFEKEYHDRFCNIGFLHDSRSVANRSKRLGWKPHRPNVYETLEEEIKYLYENGQLPPPNIVKPK